MLFYIHGFNTGANGTKAKQIAEYFDNLSFYCFDQSYHPKQAIEKLYRDIEFCRKNEGIEASQVVLIGSSLGGFYARYLMTKQPYNSVLINPSIDPYTSLKPALGAWRNFVTGEKYLWQTEHLDALRHYYVSNSALKGEVLLLVDVEDEVLDAQQAIDLYDGVADMKVYPGGSHQFEHLDEAFPIIKAFLQKKL